MIGESHHRTWPLLLSVWASFFLFAAVAAPVPGVNEPHYLCKAKHFWNPRWCSQDFFLASPNAHTVFYATVGSLTNFASFEWSARIGRFVAMLVLACGWTRCFTALFFTRWAALWCAWLFLALTAVGNFSGEWLVGGVEGKVFCYGFMFAAFGDVVRGQMLRASIWAGLSVSFHPVVGVWGLLAYASSQFVNRVMKLRRANRTPSATESSIEVLDRTPQRDSTVVRIHRGRRILSSFVLPCLILIAVALPGLIPVVRLLGEHASDDARYTATYIQVYVRLAHHLDPMMFPARAYFAYVGMLAIWLSSFAWGGRTNSKRAFDQIVVWSVVFAVAGILIGLGPRPPKFMPYFEWRMHLLKFYPFRLADVLIPIAVSSTIVSVLERTVLHDIRNGWPRYWIPFPQAFMLLVFLASLYRSSAVADTNRYSREDRADWLDVCRWIDVNLPAESLVQTPRNGWAFKWFARRSEYVTYKDCPQDSAGIVEWNRRLTFLQRWYDVNYSDSLYSVKELQDLRRQTGLTHILTDRLGPLELELIYRNGTFQVYDLTTLDHESL